MILKFKAFKYELHSQSISKLNKSILWISSHTQTDMQVNTSVLNTQSNAKNLKQTLKSTSRQQSKLQRETEEKNMNM